MAISTTQDIDQALFQASTTFVIVGLSVPIALDCAYTATRIVLKENALVYKLNFIQAIVRLINCILEVVLELRMNKDCLSLTVQYHSTAFISLVCIHLILYLKAYHTSFSTKIVAVICISLQGVEIFCLSQMFSQYQLKKGILGGCKVSFPVNYTLGMVICTTSIMIFLSSIFVYNIFRLSRFNNKGVYRVLARDGAVFGIVILCCDILLATIITLNLTNAWYLLYIGWTIKSKLMSEMMLVTHNRRKRGWSSEDNPENNTTGFFQGTLINEQPESSNGKTIELIPVGNIKEDF